MVTAQVPQVKWVVLGLVLVMGLGLSCKDEGAGSPPPFGIFGNDKKAPGQPAKGTPNAALKKMAQAIENKDLAAMKDLTADPEERDEFTKEKFDETLAEMEKDTGGHLSEILKSYPVLGNLDQAINRLELEWRFFIKEGGVVVQSGLEKIDGEWKFTLFNARLDEAEKGEPGVKAKTSPSDVLKLLISALENGDFENALNYAPEELRNDVTLEDFKAHIEETKTKHKTKYDISWFDCLKQIPSLNEGKNALVVIQIKIEYEANQNRIEVIVEFVKEEGNWKLNELDVDVREPKEKEEK